MVLSDLVDVIGGGTPKTTEESYWNGSIPWLSVKDFCGDKKYVYNTEKSITEEGLNNSSTKLLHKDNIIISARGTVGELAMIPYDMAFNQSCFGLIPKGNNDPHFVYYLLKDKVRSLKSQTQGSVFDTITKATFDRIECADYSEEDQRRIASILSSLDRKIELNNKINADLEEMAQAIFKNWFVDFEPFKDGKFVDSELGMIPEGWKVGRLDEIADVVGGSTPSKAKPEYYTQKGIAWLTPKDLSNHPAVYTSRGEIDITKEGYNSTSTKLMPKGTILFTSRAPIGYISIAQNDICTNQGFKSLVPKKAGTCFLYCFLKYVTPEIENKSTGSTFKEASGSLMKSLKVIMPEQKVFEDFETIVSPLFARIESLEKESSRLSLLRDTLLPRLMSGELEVPE
ncbi:restriction endonuclease subunit S [Segatella sp.]|uniref:restriction endonuclease subunit S n=1 Tax=Segatella sp. TaxID=2974253 RepID=UPI0030777578